MAGGIEKHGGLEIEDDFQHHVRAWRVKRVGRFLMAGFVAAALAGFLGSGPYSDTTLQAGAVKVDYQRVARFDAPTYIYLTTLGGSEPFELSLEKEFVKGIQLERINPEPIAMRLDGQKHTWTFSRTNGSSEIMITFRPQGFGKKSVRLQTTDAGTVEFNQFYLP